MEQEIEPRKGKFVFIGIILMLLIIGLSVSWFLIIKPAMTGEKAAAPVTPVTPMTLTTPIAPVTPTPKVAGGNLTITELKLCNNIDANWNCNENPTGTFKRGNSVWVYAKLTSFVTKINESKQKIGIAENVFVLNPSGVPVPKFSGKVLDFENYVTGGYIFIRNIIRTNENDTPGNYLITVVFTDKFSNKSVSGLKVFNLTK